jgi:hypothetical protein
MNSPSRKRRWILGLFKEDLRFGFALVIIRIKGGWVVDHDWGAIGIKTGISFFVAFFPERERSTSIQFKIRVLLFVGKEEMFESAQKGIQSHAKGNKKEFGEALVVFGGEFFSTLKNAFSNLF